MGRRRGGEERREGGRRDVENRNEGKMEMGGRESGAGGKRGWEKEVKRGRGREGGERMSRSVF